MEAQSRNMLKLLHQWMQFPHFYIYFNDFLIASLYQISVYQDILMTFDVMGLINGKLTYMTHYK
jgi:hypothetical protein